MTGLGSNLDSDLSSATWSMPDDGLQRFHLLRNPRIICVEFEFFSSFCLLKTQKLRTAVSQYQPSSTRLPVHTKLRSSSLLSPYMHKQSIHIFKETERKKIKFNIQIHYWQFKMYMKNSREFSKNLMIYKMRLDIKKSNCYLLIISFEGVLFLTYIQIIYYLLIFFLLIFFLLFCYLLFCYLLNYSP